MAYLATEPDIHKPLTHQVLGINNIAFSPDGQTYASSDVQMNIVVRRDGQTVFERNFGSHLDKVRPTDRIRGLRFSSDGSQLFIAAADRIYAIATETGELVWGYEPPRSFGFLIISPIALAVSGNGLVAASFDNGSIAVWNEQGDLQSLWHDNDAPRQLYFGHGGESLIGSDSFSLCVWDISRRTKTLRIPLPNRAFGMAASPVGGIVATRTLHEVVLWDLGTRSPLKSVPAEPGLPLVIFHPTKELVAVGGRHSVSLFDFGGKLIHRFEVAEASVLTIAFSLEGTSMKVGLSNEQIRELTI